MQEKQYIFSILVEKRKDGSNHMAELTLPESFFNMSNTEQEFYLEQRHKEIGAIMDVLYRLQGYSRGRKIISKEDVF